MKGLVVGKLRQRRGDLLPRLLVWRKKHVPYVCATSDTPHARTPAYHMGFCGLLGLLALLFTLTLCSSLPSRLLLLLLLLLCWSCWNCLVLSLPSSLSFGARWLCSVCFLSPPCTLRRLFGLLLCCPFASTLATASAATPASGFSFCLCSSLCSSTPTVQQYFLE